MCLSDLRASQRGSRGASGNDIGFRAKTELGVKGDGSPKHVAGMSLRRRCATIPMRSRIMLRTPTKPRGNERAATQIRESGRECPERNLRRQNMKPKPIIGEVRWERIPSVAALPEAKAWLEFQVCRGLAPNTRCLRPEPRKIHSLPRSRTGKSLGNGPRDLREIPA